MAQAESVRDLHPGNEFINGCAGALGILRESNGPFQGFGEIRLDCQRCGIVSAGLGEYIGIMNVPLSEEKMPQTTKQFLNSFCGVAKGIIKPRRRDILPIVPQVTTNPNSILLEKLGLTSRVGEVLTKTLQGQSPAEIHSGMNIKIETVYRYQQRIREALEVQTTPQVIAKVVQLGFKVSNPRGEA